MAFKIPVEDRVSTYPGRIKLTAVSGETDVYDMTRADEPVQEGTPLNKALLDNKAYTLTGDVTVCVSTSGDDANGDGSSAAPFASIQKAIDALPKHLGGYTATVDIVAGTYNERVLIEGFSGGRLILGIAGRSVIIRGLEIVESSLVISNISNVTWASGFNGTLYLVSYGSHVIQGNGCTVRCEGSESIVGVGVTNASTFVSTAVTVTVLNCTSTAIRVTTGARASFGTITGSDNTSGLIAEGGGIIAYNSINLLSTNGDASRSGGRIYTGGGTSTVASASVE